MLPYFLAGFSPSSAPTAATAPTARIEWTEVPGKPEVFTLTEAPALIGRRSDAEIPISHRLTSRQHARIIREGDSWVLIDLESSHGTWINGQRVERCELKPRDRIRLGGDEGIELVFLVGGHATTSDNMLETAGLDLSIYRLGEVLPATAGEHSELEKISCLLDFHYYFGKAFSAEKTFLHILKSALQISGAERGFVLHRKNDQFAYAQGLDGAGNPLRESDFQTSRSVVEQVTRTGEPVFMTQGIQGVLADQTSVVAMNLTSVACLPLEAISQETGAPAIMGILYLDSRKRMHPLSGIDEKLLTRLAGEAGNVLEKLELVETLAERQRVQKELAIAEQTQRTLLPLTLPDFPPFAVRAFSRATHHLGGDFYDFIPAGTSLASVVADVSGKGIPAALLSSLTLGALNTEFRTSTEPDTVLNRLNRLLCRKTPANGFVTMFLCCLDAGGRGQFVSAGHNTAFVYRAATRTLEELDSRGMPLGMFAFATYETSPLDILQGDVLVVYSDGLTDAENSTGDEFGEERLRALILGNAPNGAQALEQSLLAELDRFTRGAAQTDDITLVLIENRGA